MSKKLSKKIRKEARKVAEQKYGSALEVLGTMIKSKPKLCPKFIWILFYMPLFKKNTWKYLYKYMK